MGQLTHDNMSRVRLTSNAINSYGSRILTEGIDIEQYMRNPVLLWMHERGNVIGRLEDIQRDADGITAEVVFDEVSERSKTAKAQWDAGSLRMVSVGIEVIEVSSEPDVVMPGQTRPTITRSKLFEVSVVDVGANDDALRLTHEGKVLTLAHGVECDILPLMTDMSNLNNNDMALREQLIETLGLDTAVADSEIVDNVRLLVAYEAQTTEDLVAYEALRRADIERRVDEAISAGSIQAERRADIVEIGMQDAETLDVLLSSLSTPHASAIAQLQEGEGQEDKASLSAEWDTLDRQGLLFDLRNSDPERFQRLFKAKFNR